MAYTASTVARDTKKKDGKLIAAAMAAVKIVKGSLVHTTIATGYCTSAVPATTDIFLGVAYEGIDNSGGSAGDKKIRIERTGIHSLACASADQTVVGKEVWWSSGSSGNSQTVVFADPGASIGVKVGRVAEFVSATEVGVLIDNYAWNAATDAD